MAPALSFSSRLGCFEATGPRAPKPKVDLYTTQYLDPKRGHSLIYFWAKGISKNGLLGYFLLALGYDSTYVWVRGTVAMLRIWSHDIGKYSEAPRIIAPHCQYYPQPFTLHPKEGLDQLWTTLN